MNKASPPVVDVTPHPFPSQPRQDLELHKDTLHRLYIVEKMPLKAVMAKMKEDYGVNAS